MSLSTTTAEMFQPVTPGRGLLSYVLASIVLHAIVLLGMSRHETPAPPAKALLVLTARLAPTTAVPPSAPPPEPQAVKPPPPPPTPEPAQTPRPVLSKPATTPAPSSQKVAPAEPARPTQPEPPSAPQPAAPVESKPAPQAPATTPSAETAAPRPSADADAGTLEQYRLSLIVAARRYKRYPAIAMEKGWQGKVEVRMVIGANGMTSSASIKTSSGHEILDNQALDMIKKGKTTVQVPAGLRGREFTVDVPVIFNLENPAS